MGVTISAECPPGCRKGSGAASRVGVNDHDWTVGVGHALLRDRSEQQTNETPMPSRTRDQGGGVFAGVDQGRRRRTLDYPGLDVN